MTDSKPPITRSEWKLKGALGKRLPDDSSAPGPESPVSPMSHKTLLERVLQPHVLQRMMVAGGITLISGLAGWLWSMGAFDEPLYAAMALGVATLSCVVSGMGLHRFSRYQLAGTGLTLLGVLALPLNLWLYDAQGLIQLSQGGHLWMPAAICCLIYGFVARELRNPLFVYTLVAGAVMTGLLILADHSINRIGDPLASMTLLVVIGWICVAAERLFDCGAGDFSRERFGKAFRLSGLALLAIGLGWQFTYEVIGLPFFTSSYGTLQLLASHPAGQQLWAFLMIVFSASGFATFAAASRMQDRKLIIVTCAMVLWAILCGLGHFQIRPQLAHVMIGIQLVLIAHQLVKGSGNWFAGNADREIRLRDLAIINAGFLGVAFLQFALCLQRHLHVWPFGISGPEPLIQFSLVIVSASLAHARAFRPGRQDEIVLRALLPLVIASAGTMFAISAAWLLGAKTFPALAVAGVSIPVAFNVAQWYRRSNLALPNILNPATVACVTLVLGLLVVPGKGGLVGTSSVNAGWLLSLIAGLCLIAPVRTPADRVVGHLALLAGMAAWGDYLGISPEFGLPSALYIGGVAAWIGSHIWSRPEANSPSGPTGPFSVLAGSYFAMSSVTALLISLSRSMEGNAGWPHAAMLAMEIVATGILAFVAKDALWRPVFRSLLAGSLLSLFVVANTSVDIPPVHRIELTILCLGLISLVAGHIGWALEPEGDRSSETTAGLVLGCILTGLPLLVGLGIFNWMAGELNSPWARFHVWGVLVVALVMLFAGVMCRIRSTTLTGAVMLLVLGSTLVRIPSQMASTSFVMMIGGGLFFATAVILSIYRDRVLALPQKVREGKGLFRIMKWR